MKLVFLDAKTIGSDIDLSAFEDFGEVIYHDFTTPSEASARTQDADVLIVNKTPVNETTIGNASHLKLVCVTATGTNNLAQCGRLFYRIRCAAHLCHALLPAGKAPLLR